MNIELLLEIRDWLSAGAPEYQGFSFDMDVAISGSSVCIGGAALIFSDIDYTPDGLHDAARLLGLDWDTAHRLFYPWGYFDVDHVSPSLAAKTIDHLIETGEVQYDRYR